MKLFEVKHRSDFDDFTRITLLELFGFSIVLHIFRKSDHHCCHDHPYNILSIMLWGQYEELTPTSSYGVYRATYRQAPSIGVIPARRMHKIRLINNRKAVTLCFFGRRHRTWGFQVRGLWVASKDYFTQFSSSGACSLEEKT